MSIYDMLLANAMGESGGGGGGGSSDFSTAQVTVVNNSGYTLDAHNLCYCIEEGEFGEGSPAAIYFNLIIENGNSETFKVPMYKGLALWDSPNFTSIGSVSVTGDISDEGWGFYISGDGTITITESDGDTGGGDL